MEAVDTPPAAAAVEDTKEATTNSKEAAVAEAAGRRSFASSTTWASAIAKEFGNVVIPQCARWKTSPKADVCESIVVEWMSLIPVGFA